MYSKPKQYKQHRANTHCSMEKKQEIDDVVFGKDILSTGIAPVVQNSCGKKKTKSVHFTESFSTKVFNLT